MKLISHFQEFLADVVNLNQTRISTLESSVDALKKFVRESEWEPWIAGFEEQGSWAHDTIIRPVDGREFDADLLVLIKPVQGWTASDYVDSLFEVFSQSGTYADKVKKWDYCITVTYSGERKVDIAPCIVDRLGANTFEVCNRAENSFERSEPIAYTKWLIAQNSISGANSFRKTTRLIKYLRDIKTTFTCNSVLLTTLLGNNILGSDKGSAQFADVPTTLQTLIGRLDDFLRSNPNIPRVENPHLATEDFAHSWTTEQYSNFRDVIKRYRGWVDAAMAAEDRDSSVLAWRRLFGEDFAPGVDAKAKSLVETAHQSVKSLVLASGAHLNELVEQVKTFGIEILPLGFNKPPYISPPRWPRVSTPPFSVVVTARHQSSRDAAVSTPIISGQPVPAAGGFWLDVRQPNGTAIPSGYFVEWRITNTGVVALQRGEGRGAFYVSNRQDQRWEGLRYRGVHIAEAFVVRLSDGMLAAQSEPFYVVVE